jgi:D-alanyl-D-alanine carboxypeptidase
MTYSAYAPFLCLALSSVTACSDDDPPAFPVELAAELQAVLDQNVADGVAPGVSLHVSHPDRGDFVGAAGIGDLDAERAMRADGHLRAGSMLKPLVAAAVLQRVEAGDLDLEATLDELLPAATTAQVANAETITLRMLLAHRSGIPDAVTPEVRLAAAGDPAHVWTVAEFLASAAAQEPGVPGAAYSYSNTNYILLGEILTAVAGRDWRDVVTDDVIARAGMTHSALPRPGDRELPAPANLGYVDLGDGLVDFSTMDPSMALGSGGHALISTTADLVAFTRALFDGELFDDPATLETMLAFQPAPDAPENPQVGYGLGVAQHDINGVEYLGHLGRTAGYWGFALYAPELGYTLSGVMNVEGDLGALVLPITAALAE